MLWVGVTISVLLVINSWLLTQFLIINRDWIPPIPENRKWIEQVIGFVVPVCLIFIEFWVFDWLQDMTSDPPKKIKKIKS